MVATREDVDRKVLILAKEGGYFDGPIPEDVEELASQATYYESEADKAWDSGMRDPTVGKILVAVGGLTQEEFEEAMAEGEVISQPGNDHSGEVEEMPEDEAETTIKVSEANTAVEAESESEAWMRKNKLPIPASPELQGPDLPADLTTLDDRVLRKFHSLNNSYLGRARWLLGIATGDLIRAEHLRDEAYRKALLKVNRIDPKTEKPKSVASLDAEAKEDIDYQDWAEAANKHEREVAIRKSVVEIYQSNVAVLSREWTMRTEEFERSK